MELLINTELLKDFKPEEVILIEWMINEFIPNAKDFYASGCFDETNEIMLSTKNLITKSPFGDLATEVILKNLEKSSSIERCQDLFEFNLVFKNEKLKQYFKNRIKKYI